MGIGLSLLTVGIGHGDQLTVAFAIIYASMGAQQENAGVARDLGATEAWVLLLVTAPMLSSYSCCLFFSVTLSWDDYNRVSSYPFDITFR